MALDVGLNVKMVKKVMIFLWLSHDETNSCTSYNNVARMLWGEASCKPLSGSNRIKTTNSFKTFSHSFDAKRNQIVKVTETDRN